MPRHIRGFFVTSARKFKLSNYPSCPDNKKNDRHLQAVCMFCAITSLLVKCRKSLHSDNTWDQAERAQGPIYIINGNFIIVVLKLSPLIIKTKNVWDVFGILRG